MRIPMRGAVGSLNAAVAGSVLLFEAVAQRDPDGRAAALPGEPAPRVDDPIDPAATPDPVRDDDPSPAPVSRPQDVAAIDAEAELLPGEGVPAVTPRPRKPRAPRTPHA